MRKPLKKGPLPRINPRRPAGDGWQTQILDYGYYRNFKRGYVKIINPQGECVDTALTVATARKRIKKLKEPSNA